jgi:hypothetical protein
MIDAHPAFQQLSVLAFVIPWASNGSPSLTGHLNGLANKWKHYRREMRRVFAGYGRFRSDTDPAYGLVKLSK